MVDWMREYFGDNILVKISGKAPRLKCSHYIHMLKYMKHQSEMLGIAKRSSDLILAGEKTWKKYVNISIKSWF